MCAYHDSRSIWPRAPASHRAAPPASAPSRAGLVRLLVPADVLAQRTAASLLPAPFLGLLPKELQEPPGGSDGKDDDDQDRLEMKGLLDEVERGTTPTPR